MTTEDRYDALLGDLYAGAIERERMSAFQRSLGDLTGSHAASFLREDFANPSRSALLATGVSSEEIRRYDAFVGDNIWFERALPDFRRGTVFNGDAYVSRKELVGSRYYDGFLRHVDTQHSVGICIAYQKSRAVFLSFCRSGRFGVYDDDSLRLFRRVAPHVVNAFELQVQFEYLDAQAAQATCRQRGMFLFDAQWRRVGENPAAENMMTAGWWRGRRLERLEACHAMTRVAWRSVQHQIATGIATQQVIPVHDINGHLVAFASAHTYGAAAIGEHIPCYVLFVRPLRSVSADALGSHLRQLFGLTAAESTLVLALRTHGDIPRVAAALGIAESSARTRLQTVFEKTGTHRRAELLRMIDALAETVA